MIHRLCFIAMTFALSACVSVLPEASVPEALYRIPAPDTLVRLDRDVLIREPDAARVLAGRAIASEDEDGALRLVAEAEWADRATRLMQFALVESFDPDAPGRALGVRDPGAPVLELDWRLLDFHLGPGAAECRLAVSLFDTGRRTLTARTEIAVSMPFTGNRIGDRMDAMRNAATGCVGATAAFIAGAVTNAAGESPPDAGSGDAAETGRTGQAAAVLSRSATGR